MVNQNLIEKGELLFKQGKFGEAENQFLLAVEHDPENKEAHNNLGVIAFSELNHEKAILHFKKAIEIDPLYLDALLNLGDVLRITNALAEGLPVIAKALEYDPQNLELYKLAKEIEAAISKGNPNPTSASPANNADHQMESSSGLPITEPILLACLPRLDNFVDDLIGKLAGRVPIRKVVSDALSEFLAAIPDYRTIWLEWGNDLAIALTTDSKRPLRGKRVICRIHSYEVLDGIADRIDYNQIDDLVFVAPHIRDILLNRRPEIVCRVKRIHCIPNGIDLSRFTFLERKRGFDIACVGSLNHKKDPMVMMHGFKGIHDKDPRYRLHIAGDIQDQRYAFAIDSFIENNELKGSVFFYGFQKDVYEWLVSMSYILCSSLMEGHPVALMEAMATGCKPLIYHFPGADSLYPKQYLWRNVDELVQRIEEPYQPQEYRTFIADNFSLDIQAKRVQCMIIDRCVVGMTPLKLPQPPTTKPTPRPYARKVSETTSSAADFNWEFPDEALAPDPQTRLNILLVEAEKQVANRRFELARVTLQRAARLSSYGNDAVMRLWLEVCKELQDIPAIQQIWKRIAVEALLHGDLNGFLICGYHSIHAEIMNAREPAYVHSIIDEDFHAYMRLAASSLPLRHWVDAHRVPIESASRSRRLRLGFVLEGFSQVQAPIGTYRTIAAQYDPDRYELFFFSRISLNTPIAKAENYAAVIEEFQKHGGKVFCPGQSLSPLDEVQFLTEAIVNQRIDILVYQTVYFVPQYNLLSWLRPAHFQVSVCHQQPEFSSSVDLVLTERNTAIDTIVELGESWITISKDLSTPAHERIAFGIPADAVVLIVANRNLKYYGEGTADYWRAIDAVLTSHSKAWFIPMGLEKVTEDIPITGENRNRILAPGFRQDLSSFMRMSDIYIDNFTHTSGAVIEAAAVGLPVVAINRFLLGKPFEVASSDYTVAFLPQTELLIRDGDWAQWRATVDRLITDPIYRLRLGQLHQEFARCFEPKSKVEHILQGIERSYFMRVENPGG